MPDTRIDAALYVLGVKIMFVRLHLPENLQRFPLKDRIEDTSVACLASECSAGTASDNIEAHLSRIGCL